MRKIVSALRLFVCFQFKFVRLYVRTFCERSPLKKPSKCFRHCRKHQLQQQYKPRRHIRANSRAHKWLMRNDYILTFHSWYFTSSIWRCQVSYHKIILAPFHSIFNFVFKYTCAIQVILIFNDKFISIAPMSTGKILAIKCENSGISIVNFSNKFHISIQLSRTTILFARLSLSLSFSLSLELCVCVYKPHWFLLVFRTAHNHQYTAWLNHYYIFMDVTAK